MPQCTTLDLPAVQDDMMSALLQSPQADTDTPCIGNWMYFWICVSKEYHWSYWAAATWVILFDFD